MYSDRVIKTLKDIPDKFLLRRGIWKREEYELFKIEIRVVKERFRLFSECLQVLDNLMYRR